MSLTLGKDGTVEAPGSILWAGSTMNLFSRETLLPLGTAAVAGVTANTVTLGAALPAGVGQWDLVNNAASYADYVEVRRFVCDAGRVFAQGMPPFARRHGSRCRTAPSKIIVRAAHCSSPLMCWRRETYSTTLLGRRSKQRRMVRIQRGCDVIASWATCDFCAQGATGSRVTPSGTGPSQTIRSWVVTMPRLPR